MRLARSRPPFLVIVAGVFWVVLAVKSALDREWSLLCLAVAGFAQWGLYICDSLLNVRKGITTGLEMGRDALRGEAPKDLVIDAVPHGWVRLEEDT